MCKDRRRQDAFLRLPEAATVTVHHVGSQITHDLVCRLGLVARKTIGVLLCGVNVSLSRQIGENLGRSTDQKYCHADLEKDPDHNDNVAAKEGFSDMVYAHAHPHRAAASRFRQGLGGKKQKIQERAGL